MSVLNLYSACKKKKRTVPSHSIIVNIFETNMFCIACKQENKNLCYVTKILKLNISRLDHKFKIITINESHTSPFLLITQIQSGM
jgi:hypothetical protein